MLRAAETPAPSPRAPPPPTTLDTTSAAYHPQVGFYRELLSFGFNVWACDADAVFMNDPRPMMRERPWTEADVAIATDCIDLPSDARSPLLHCDFNTGLVFLRSSPAVLGFTERWKETVASAREKRIRDQAAFNMLTKQPGRPLQPYLFSNGTRAERLYTTEPSPGVSLKLLVLPLDRFLNGHTYFVQHAHTLPHAKPAVSVHMTYQFGEGLGLANPNPNPHPHPYPNPIPNPNPNPNPNPSPNLVSAPRARCSPPG